MTDTGETTGTDKQPPEAPITPPTPRSAEPRNVDAEGYEDVSGGETTPQSGAGETSTKEHADG